MYDNSIYANEAKNSMNHIRKLKYFLERCMFPLLAALSLFVFVLTIFVNATTTKIANFDE